MMNDDRTTATRVIRKAPAKLNLSLRVCERRSDGFHEIETVMVPVPDLHDVLSFELAGAFTFSSNDRNLPDGDANLVVRAANAFADAAGQSLKVRIQLEKRIPSGAGLGGGSSDAAATLTALNALYGEPLGEDKLHAIASSLGSDVPFFLHSCAARCSGRGEIVEPLTGVRTINVGVVLLKPAFPVATVDAYRRVLDASIRAIPGIPLGGQSLGGMVEMRNDFERSVFSKHRFLAELKLWLLDRREVAAAMMSGSGATLMAFLHDDCDPASLIRASRHEMDGRLWSWSGRIDLPAGR